MRALPVWLVALAGYIVLAAAVTWPLILHLGDRFPGQRPNDAYFFYWTLWWFKQAVTSGQNPYHAPLWYPPDGTDLSLATLSPLNGVLALAPQALFGTLVAYNVMALTNITLVGLGTFLLARHVTGHTGGAAVAGVVAAAGPYLIYQLNHGHLHTIAFYGLPLFAYCLLRAAEGSWRHVPLAALALLITALGEWQNAVSALLVAGVLLAWQMLAAVRRERPWGAPLRMIVAGLLGGLLLLPFALNVVRAVEAAGPVARLGDTVNRSVNLVAYVLPQELHPLWGDAISQWRRANLWEPVTSAMASLGLVVIIVAIVAVARAGWPTLPWLVMVLLGAGLALGPQLHIGVQPFDVLTPFAILGQAPYMDVSRNPSRYVVVATIGIAVLSAFGVRWLTSRPATRAHGSLIAGLVGLVILAELWPAPFYLSLPPDTVVVERVGREIAASDPAGTVLTIPYKSDDPYVMFHQAHHQRPLFSGGGAVTRLPEPTLRTSTPGFADLVRDRPYRDIFQRPIGPLEALNAFRVRYVLYYPDEVPERERAFYQRQLKRVLEQTGPAYTSADGLLEAWRVPVSEVTAPFLRIGPGWQSVENWTGIGSGRWLRGEGTLYLERPTAVPVTLEFSAVSFARPRTLEVRDGAAVLAVAPVGVGLTPVRLTVPAGAGRATLSLRAREGADPRDQVAFEDKRPLTIGLANVLMTVEPVLGGRTTAGVELRQNVAEGINASVSGEAPACCR